MATSHTKHHSARSLQRMPTPALHSMGNLQQPFMPQSLNQVPRVRKISSFTSPTSNGCCWVLNGRFSEENGGKQKERIVEWGRSGCWNILFENNAIIVPGVDIFTFFVLGNTHYSPHILRMAPYTLAFQGIMGFLRGEQGGNLVVSSKHTLWGALQCWTSCQHSKQVSAVPKFGPIIGSIMGHFHGILGLCKEPHEPIVGGCGWPTNAVCTTPNHAERKSLSTDC